MERGLGRDRRQATLWDIGPAHHEPARFGAIGHLAALGRIQVIKEWRDTRDSRQETAQVARRGRHVTSGKGQVAVRVDEDRRVSVSVEGEGKAQGDLLSIIVGQREHRAGCGCRGIQRCVPGGDLVAGAGRGETQAAVRQVKRIRLHQQCAIVVEDCDVAYIGGSRLLPSEGLKVPLALQLQFSKRFTAQGVQHAPVAGATTIPSLSRSVATVSAGPPAKTWNRTRTEHVTQRRTTVISGWEILSCCHGGLSGRPF